MEGGDFRVSSIDQRVVQMQFDNRQFEAGIKTSLTSLDNLNKGLKLEGATKGLTDVGAAVKSFSIAGIAAGVDTIADRFKAMSVIGITVLTNLATKALEVGSELVKSFTRPKSMQSKRSWQTLLRLVRTSSRSPMP
jgi:hypothetical protein